MIAFILLLSFLSASTTVAQGLYRGSTPAHREVRDFLSIPQEDSIDFIRWTLSMRADDFDLKCQFGLSKPGTNGFVDEKEIAFSGALMEEGNYVILRSGHKMLHLIKINSNLFHLLNKEKAFLVGNGGYSYVLNSDAARQLNDYNVQRPQAVSDNIMAFEGRTPCRELSQQLGLNKSTACDKLKWYFILYSDSATGKPDYYLRGGTAYRKQSMSRGNWEIRRGEDGRVIYILDPAKKASAIYLVKADNNILFFSDPKGNLLVGNENFSYALNRTVDKEP